MEGAVTHTCKLLETRRGAANPEGTRERAFLWHDGHRQEGTQERQPPTLSQATDAVVLSQPEQGEVCVSFSCGADVVERCTQGMKLTWSDRSQANSALLTATCPRPTPAHATTVRHWSTGPVTLRRSTCSMGCCTLWRRARSAYAYIDGTSQRVYVGSHSLFVLWCVAFACMRHV